MISRIWHGWTTFQNADAYEQLLNKEIFVEIAARQLAGLRGIQLLRRELESEVEFSTIMWFDDLDSVKEFAGKDDYEEAYVPDSARVLLARFDARAVHSNLKQALAYP